MFSVSLLIIFHFQQNNRVNVLILQTKNKAMKLYLHIRKIAKIKQFYQSEILAASCSRMFLIFSPRNTSGNFNACSNGFQPFMGQLLSLCLLLYEIVKASFECEFIMLILYAFKQTRYAKYATLR